MRTSGWARVAMALVLASSIGCGATGDPPDGGDGNDAGGGGGPDAGTTGLVLRGAVEKGPFVIGSTVQVAPLDGDLQPAGTVFSTNTTSDLGEFEVRFQSSGPVALSGNGFYYNELTGGVSAAPITLRAFYVPSADAQQRAYVNLVTHLTTERIQSLVRAGSGFDAAVTQAEADLLAQLGIAHASYTPGARGIELNVAGGDNDDNAYLLAVSAVLLQAADARAERTGSSLDGAFQELLNQFSLDLTDGLLAPTRRTELDDARRTLDLARVQRLLAARLTELGSGQAVPDSGRVLDQDDDDIVNADDVCPLVADPAQADRDGDGVGDACDTCPDTACARPSACLPASLHGFLEADLCYAACDPDGEDTCGTGKCRVVVQLTAQSDGQCADGSPGCFDAPLRTPVPICLPDCVPSDPDPCGPGRTCRASGSVIRPTANQSYAATWSCLPDALAQDITVESCDPAEQTDPNAMLSCLRASSCLNHIECPAGAFCVKGEPVMGGIDGGDRCMPACADECGGIPCVPVTIGGASTGVCAPTSDEDPDHGGPGEPCRNDGGCDGSLSCLDAHGSLCAAGQANCCLETGNRDQPCNPGGTCNNPLDLGCIAGSTRCAAEACCEARPDDDGMGALGEPCLPDASCDPQLACIDDPTRRYCMTSPRCCVAAGGAGQPCIDGVFCTAASTMCLRGIGDCGAASCCVPDGGGAGGDFREACGPEGACLADLQCTDSTLSCLDGLTRCCLPTTGGPDQPCQSGTTCHARGYACRTDAACTQSPCCLPESIDLTLAELVEQPDGPLVATLRDVLVTYLVETGFSVQSAQTGPAAYVNGGSGWAANVAVGDRIDLPVRALLTEFGGKIITTFEAPTILSRGHPVAPLVQTLSAMPATPPGLDHAYELVRIEGARVMQFTPVLVTIQYGPVSNVVLLPSTDVRAVLCQGAEVDLQGLVVTGPTGYRIRVDRTADVTLRSPCP